jgi:hypothetical protein
MHTHVVRALALGAILASPIAAGAQSGGFIVKLGVDTFAIERFARSGNRIDGAIVRRTPQTSIVKYTISLNADGTVAAFEQSTLRPDGTPIPNAPSGLRMTFTGDSVVREGVVNGQPTVRRSAAPKATLPAIGLSFLAYEMQLQTARRDGAAHIIGFGAQQAAPARVDTRFVGSDSAEIVVQGFRTGFKLDANGRIVRGDGSLTTQKFLVTPVGDVDVNAVASAWAAKEASGGGMGPASTRDTVSATIGGAKLWIDYGRPAKRGREIWGKLVPYDTTWRFGANAATQMRTDKDLELGGVTVPAGFYTLWLLPRADSSWLIVNSQTGQWGTTYDATKDVARIPLEKHMNLPASEERFRIFVDGDRLMMHWDRGGYGVSIRAR